MAKCNVFFDEVLGKVKPMHATNNGPVVRLSDVQNGTLHPFNNNLEPFRAAGIPYARTHDTSFYHRYGLEHAVDVHYVFPDFDADPTLPENYDFACTDHYLEGCALAGTEVFYRLGARIEHEVKRYGTLPPKDFGKWAVICEHIIRHYNEGWANGYHMNITYWEIWNEPDLHPGNSPTWGGTKEQFFELYHVCATHLKACFPHLKIGGPALAYDLAWAEDFLAGLKAPLDFFSWHCYAAVPEQMVSIAQKVRTLLDRYGFEKTESILNEWSYVRGWEGDNIVYSHRQRGKIKGASFSLAAMCACQDTTDMLMYYDARPNEFWNGMFDDTVVGEVLKGYYPFKMFDSLYRLGGRVRCEADGNIYLAAAKGDTEASVIFTHYNEDDSTEEKTVSLSMEGFGGENGVQADFYLLDETHDLSFVGSVTYEGEKLAFSLPMPNFTCYWIQLRKK